MEEIINMYIKDLLRGKKLFHNVPDRYKDVLTQVLYEKGYVIENDKISEITRTEEYEYEHEN